MISTTQPGTHHVEYLGLSRDKKPTNATNGSIFFEMDTVKVYMFDAENGIWHDLTGE